MEWALVSKSNPKKILKWFGPERPTKKEIAKEERRIHAFGAANVKDIIDSEENMNIQILKKLISLSNHLDSKGLSKEADVLDEIIKSAKKKKKKKKPSKKQLKSLDKNNNGKIDKEDFKLLRKKKNSKAKKKCANCGHMNHHDAKKCSKCGHTKFEK